jgi:hypothetical protein
MHLRTPTLDDLPLLRSWDQKPHVMAASGADPSWDDCIVYRLDRKDW